MRLSLSSFPTVVYFRRALLLHEKCALPVIASLSHTSDILPAPALRDRIGLQQLLLWPGRWLEHWARLNERWLRPLAAEWLIEGATQGPLAVLKRLQQTTAGVTKKNQRERKEKGAMAKGKHRKIVGVLRTHLQSEQPRRG